MKEQEKQAMVMTPLMEQIMKKSIVVLSLWIGISLFGMEAAYRRGVEAMVANAHGGHGVWSAEYGIGVMRRHGGAASEAAVLKLAMELLSDEKTGDLLDGLREAVCGGGTAVLSKLEGAQGGWAVEIGGQSELWGTLLAMECLLELDEPPVACGRGWKWLVERMLVADGELSGDHDWRIVGQFLVVAGLARRHGWGLDARSRNVVEEVVGLVEEEGLSNHESGDTSIYDSSLILRGLCLLGRHLEGEPLARRLVETQMEDGCWHDGSVGDDWLVTCAAVEALGCYLAAIRQDDGLTVEFRPVDGNVPTCFGAREYVQLELDGVADGTVVTLEILKNSEIIDFRYIGEPTDGGCSWFTGTCVPGDYELRVVFWDGDELSWLGEVGLEFEIKPDASCHNVMWEEPLRDMVAHGGDDWCASWCMAWDYDGNVTEIASMSWQLTLEGDGIETGETSVELSPSRRHGRMILKDGPMVAPSIPGTYELTGRLVTSNGEYSCRRSLKVVSGAVYAVENDVSPRQITLGASRLHHTLRIFCVEGDVNLAAAGFTVATENRGIIDETGEKLVVELTDIHGVDGGLMEDGWLAVQSHYGRCEGELNLGTSRVEGFLCGIHVVDGRATLIIEAEGHGKIGTTAVSVYQLQSDGGEIGGKLGQFEIHWIKRK